ncbi:Rieske 2Fe-2S domain-containing protein [Streptomyces turgidiscabies]|uniref:Phenylpropionate dioxygenase-like ring-hydroxylating dioxygenase large terminal subunit n=1 Tax=Streptomyces turgidiscabies TaxID=85558 RepID=A0ABU0RUE2_9ACTN|nr:Rieske 2Fe-2S domain-containing protein [Streptomyces turgidiscabies]MDQ0935618.1 phenylpropionate dioxygenase-like ring-hydroxylating dioxygenase large terminal subunit [Streptomyces turgidiscabies]
MTTALPRPAPPRDSTFAPDDWAVLARHRYPVALSGEVGDAPTAVRLLDETLVAYRVSGNVVVAHDICPHRGVPLSLGDGDGDGDGSGIACACHGLRFGDGGRCVHVPAHPESGIPSRLNLRTCPVVERSGLVWTCLRPAPDADPVIPAMAHWDDEGFQRINCPSMRRLLEHDLQLPTRQRQTGPARLPVASPLRRPPALHRHPGGALPRRRLNIMNAASPVSARRTRMFAPIARDSDTDQPVQAVYDVNRTVFEEDRAIVEVQKPENLPLDRRRP